MKCPFCSSAESRVADSRLSRDKEAIRRRRQCLSCGRRFTTSERVESVMPMVVKRDGRREPFNRLKIMSGLRKACEKRPISIDHLERVVNRIEQVIQEAGEREVKSTVIGQKVTDELRSLNGVAYVRFASVYRQFKDINEFMDELTELLGNRTKETRKGRKKR
jgi:transcriptional repressor NrdR